MLRQVFDDEGLWEPSTDVRSATCDLAPEEQDSGPSGAPHVLTRLR